MMGMHPVAEPSADEIMKGLEWLTSDDMSFEDFMELAQKTLLDGKLTRTQWHELLEGERAFRQMGKVVNGE